VVPYHNTILDLIVFKYMFCTLLVNYKYYACVYWYVVKHTKGGTKKIMDAKEIYELMVAEDEAEKKGDKVLGKELYFKMKAVNKKSPEFKEAYAQYLSEMTKGKHGGI